MGIIDIILGEQTGWVWTMLEFMVIATVPVTVSVLGAILRGSTLSDDKLETNTIVESDCEL